MTLTQWGLILNTLGSIILCFYGVPKIYSEKGGSFPLMYRADNEESKKHARKWEVSKWISLFGVFFLLLGFILQLFDSFRVNPIT